ncbi:MAG: methyltransferase domain-containing protein [Magnetospirillum sp.]|nr:methyltransferase domain-containing protein [Magnetospirillum sp.]
MPPQDELSTAGPRDALPKPSQLGLRARLHAWWEGYEIDKKRPEQVLRSPRAETKAEPSTPPTPPKDFWGPERILVGQMIWGDGFTFPGGGEFAADLAQALVVNKNSIAMDIGCGLGGGTRAIVERFGAKAHGFDMSPELARAGDALSAKAGLDLRAPIASFDLEAPDWPKQHFDAALMRSVLSVVPDKVAFVRLVGESLKRAGRLVLLDWALAEDERQGPAFAAYIAGEARPTHLGTVGQLTYLVETAGFTVRTTEDYTDTFAPIVLDGWSRIESMVTAGMLKPAEGKALLNEAQLWARRIAAMKAGELRVARIEAHKKA